MRVGFQISALTHSAKEEAAMGTDGGRVHIGPDRSKQAGFHLTWTTQSLNKGGKLPSIHDNKWNKIKQK